MVEIRREPIEPIEKERAYEHVLLNIRREHLGQVRDLEGWGVKEVDPEPVEILDLSGQLLFYEFQVMDGKKQAGTVKASASKAIGAPIVTVELGERPWDPSKVQQEAKKLVKKKDSKAKISGTELVCYCYPRIGVRVDYSLPDEGDKVAIFDVSTMAEVEPEPSVGIEGSGMYSFYEEFVFPDMQKRLETWKALDRELEMAKESMPGITDRGLTPVEIEKLRPSIAMPGNSNIVIPPFFVRELKYAPRCTPHNCFELRAQKTNFYCAVATGQMILDFYRYYYSQDAIARAMHTTSGGTTLNGQVDGYETLSKGCLDASIDYSANWWEAASEINSNRPLKSGIPGHARACAGWKKSNIFVIGTGPQRWLKIYDPWPWNPNPCRGGRIYWENWNGIRHTNFIYVRHRKTACR